MQLTVSLNLTTYKVHYLIESSLPPSKGEIIVLVLQMRWKFIEIVICPEGKRKTQCLALLGDLALSIHKAPSRP